LRTLGVRCSDVLVMATKNTSLPSLTPPLHEEKKLAPGSSSTAAAPPSSRCTNCGALAALEPCSGCYKARYCSNSCQFLHWNVHRQACVPAPVAPATCSQGHTMVKTDGTTPPKTYTTWQCDACGLPGSGPRWWCQICHYDLCFKCGADAKKGANPANAPLPTPTATAASSSTTTTTTSSSSVNRQRVVGEDGRLYCGQWCNTYFDEPQRRCRVKGTTNPQGACYCDGYCGRKPWNGVRILLLRFLYDLAFVLFKTEF